MLTSEAHSCRVLHKCEPTRLRGRGSWVALGGWLQVESGRGWQELAALGLHYSWYLGMVFSWLPPAKAALFLLLSQMFAGFLLSIVFVQVSRRLPIRGAALQGVPAGGLCTMHSRGLGAGLVELGMLVAEAYKHCVVD